MFLITLTFRKNPREGKASYNLNFHFNIFIDAELHVNVIPDGKEDSGLDKVCRIPILCNAIHIINTHIRSTDTLYQQSFHM